MTPHRPTRRAMLLALALTATVGPAASAFAQAYPAKPVKVIVPYSPGSNPDVATRIVMQALQERLGHPFVVDTKVGAGGGIGLSAGAKAAPDGYTIVVGHVGGLAVNPNIYSSLPYNANTDFVPIIQMYTSPLVLLVAKDSPYKNVGDLIADAKARPGQLTFSSGGNGNGAHLTGESLAKMTGVSMRHIPYKGMGPGMTDVVGGIVTFTFGNYSLGMPLVKGGRMRALALSGADRDPQYPDIPVVAETVKGFEFEDWTGVLAPKGTPPEIVKKLQSEISAVLAKPEVIQLMHAQGLNPVKGGTSEQFAKFIQSEQAKWGAIAKSINLKID
jgi:tripartite-type tricarboxylate transporter receptor subunit TctC